MLESKCPPGTRSEWSAYVLDLTGDEPNDHYTVQELATIGREYALLRITWSDGRVEYEEFLPPTELARALHDVSIATLDLAGYGMTLAGTNSRGQEVIEYAPTAS